MVDQDSDSETLDLFTEPADYVSNWVAKRFLFWTSSGGTPKALFDKTSTDFVLL
jgi:hypothetical protein